MMDTTYLNYIANYGATILTHAGLKNAAGVEISGGTPAYSRQPITWGQSVNGSIALANDVAFNIPAGANVASWFVTNSAGVVLGSGSMAQENYTDQGEYILKAGTSHIDHSSN